MDPLRNLVVSSTWISVNAGQSTLASVFIYSITDRESRLPTQSVAERGRKCWTPASGGHYKRKIAEGREGSRGTVGTSATIFSVMQRSHLFSCSCHRFIQIPEIHKDKCIISFWDRSAVKDAVKAVQCGTVASLNLCNGLVPQAVHTQSYTHWIYSCKLCGHWGWRSGWSHSQCATDFKKRFINHSGPSQAGLWCHDRPYQGLAESLLISRVIHPPAVASRLHVLPAAYICLANWKLFFHENQMRSISVGNCSLPS